MATLKVDEAVFLWRSNNEVRGVIVVHVDDMLFFGSIEFHKTIMKELKRIFRISREDKDSFRYLGVNMKHEGDSIVLEQKAYVDSLKDHLISKELYKNKKYVSEAEKKLFRMGVGQLGWLEHTTKPEIGFAFCQLSMVQKDPQMKDFAMYAKTVKDVKANNSGIRVSKLDLSTAVVKVFSDASYGNLTDGGSQIGYLVFLCDDANRAVPISWGSKKARRVARSTLTAETLAAGEGVDAAIVVKQVVEEVMGGHLPPIQVYVDNKSLCDAAHTTNSLAQKSLRVDMAAIRQMIERGDMTMEWIPAELQLADVLTKQGVNKDKLRVVLNQGSIQNNVCRNI